MNAEANGTEIKFHKRENSKITAHPTRCLILAYQLGQGKMLIMEILWGLYLNGVAGSSYEPITESHETSFGTL